MGFEPLLDYRAVSAGKTTCAALVEEALLRAKNAAHLNLFIELFDESVRAQAQDVDRRLAAGRRSGRQRHHAMLHRAMADPLRCLLMAAGAGTR